MNVTCMDLLIDTCRFNLFVSCTVDQLKCLLGGNYAAGLRKCMPQNIKSGQDGPVDLVRHLLELY